MGDSALEKYWVGQLRDSFKRFGDRLEFTWFNELSFAEMLNRSAALPPHSAILFVVLSIDAAGVAHEEGKAVDHLHNVANAPIFSFTDAYLGRGVVGGPMTSVLEMSQKAASVALRILSGEQPSDIKIEPIKSGTPRFDWREMQRWDIKDANLPPGSVVEFRVPTIFEQYKWYILAVIAVCLIQAAVISALLLERVYRQRAERAARDLSERLISAQEDERSRLARELHDDVTQRLAVLAIEAGRAAGRGRNVTADASMHDIRGGLVKLSEDVHALSYRLHPSILDDLGLVEALKAEGERFSKLESLPVDVTIEEDLVAPSPQTALGLFRIAQEALQNIGRHAKASRAEITLRRLDNGLQLCVRDNGVGFDPKHRKERASLGLASMQQRIYLLGGRLDIDSRSGQGTTVLAWVPAMEEHHEASARVAGG